MPERERAPVAGGTDEVGGDEAVERDGDVAVSQRRCGGELGIERVARDGRALDQGPRGRRQRPDLEADRRHEGRRQRLSRIARDPTQLLEEQRIAARLAHDAVAQRAVRQLGDERAGGVVGERAGLDVLPRGRRAGGVEQPRRGRLGPQREREQVRRARRPAQQVQDQLDRGLVGPVEVVEHQRDGPLAAQQLEQRPDRAVVAEALCRSRGGTVAADATGARRRRRGQHGGEVGSDRLDAARVQRRDVVVERVDHEPERHGAPVLCRAALEHEHPGVRRALAQRTEQGALADPGLAEQPQRASAAAPCILHGPVHAGELRLASQQLHRRRERSLSRVFLHPRIG
jgi:hypothetical protein